MKIISCFWLSNLKDGSFGIVKIKNEADEVKFYIGQYTSGETEENSAQRIAELGCPIFEADVKRFFNF